ncbi:formyltransferase family protein [Halosolutus halophilus]|uniref:formyltransferase family protein n=1 Tax=Halosolutus halophilus TaxID=1552990 RepID=UPI0022351A83|nr:formyltransferase family protein [Halosolutus halophilus]
MPAYQTMVLQELVDRTDVDISLVVINDETHRLRDRSPFDLFGRARTWGAWLPVGAAIVLTRAVRGPPAYDTPRPFSSVDALADADVVRCSPNWEGDVWRSIPDPVVDEIADRSDVVVRFGFGLLTGRILDAPEHGVLSFHFSDIREYRGRIGALWEFIDDEDSVGVTLQQLTRQVDGGRIVAADDVPIYDRDTYGRIKRRQRTTLMGELLVEGIRNLSDDDFEPTAPDELGTYRSAPTVLEVLRYVRKNGANKIRHGFSRRLDVD